MRYLFIDDHKNIIEKLSKTKTLYAFDFDGTLSKINKSITSATLPLNTSKLLATLLSYAPVAVISGRRVKDLKNRVRIPGIYLIGNHGLEGIPKWGSKKLRAKSITKKWLCKLREQNLENGIFIEDKVYSLSIHYRKCKDRGTAAKQIELVLNDLRPAPRIITGKCVYNIVPQQSPDKGAALKELKKLKHVSKVFYIGDDDTDEDVFKLTQPFLTTVRVGKRANSKAQFYIKQQFEVNKVLKLLINAREIVPK